MQYGNLTPPRANVPLTIPFLAHDNFTTETQQWLRTIIQHHKAPFTFLHIDSGKLFMRHYAANFTTTTNGRTVYSPQQIHLTSLAHVRTSRRFSLIQTIPPPTSTTSSPLITSSFPPPSHLPQRQHEQHLFPYQSKILPSFPNSLSRMAPHSRFSTIPPNPFSITNGNSTSLTSNKSHTSQLACFASCRNISVTKWSCTMLTMSCSSSASFVASNISAEPSTPGKHLNFSNHYPA